MAVSRKFGVARGVRPAGYEPAIQPAGRNFSAITDDNMWNWAVRISVVGLFVIVLGAMLQILQHIAVPLALAWVIATVLLPVISHLSKLKIPRALAAVIVVALLLLGILAILFFLTVPLSYWLSRADELGQLIKEKMALIQQPLEMLEELGRAINPSADGEKPPVFVNTSKSTMITTMLNALTPAIDEFLIFVIALVFHLIYQKEIKSGIVALVSDSKGKELVGTMLGDIERNMSSYFGTVTVVNSVVGIVVMTIAYFLGYPHPVLWGVFAFVMNFIPYIGPLFVLIALFLVGVVVFPTFQQAATAPLVFLAFNTLEGQVITPAFVGHRLTINPFLVFLSIAFWTWLWGPLGAFLAVPLLLAAIVAKRHLSNLRTAS